MREPDRTAHPLASLDVGRQRPMLQHVARPLEDHCDSAHMARIGGFGETGGPGSAEERRWLDEFYERTGLRRTDLHSTS